MGIYSDYMVWFIAAVPVAFSVLSIIGFFRSGWGPAPWVLLELALIVYSVASTLSSTHPEWFLSYTHPDGTVFSVDIQDSEMMLIFSWFLLIPVGYVLAWGATRPWTRRTRLPQVRSEAMWKWRPYRGSVVMAGIAVMLVFFQNEDVWIGFPTLLLLILSIVTAVTDRGWAPPLRLLWACGLQIVMGGAIVRLDPVAAFFLCLTLSILAMMRSRLFVYPVVPTEVRLEASFPTQGHMRSSLFPGSESAADFRGEVRE